MIEVFITRFSAATKRNTKPDAVTAKGPQLILEWYRGKRTLKIELGNQIVCKRTWKQKPEPEEVINPTDAQLQLLWQWLLDYPHDYRNV